MVRFWSEGAGEGSSWLVCVCLFVCWSVTLLDVQRVIRPQGAFHLISCSHVFIFHSFTVPCFSHSHVVFFKFVISFYFMYHPIPSPEDSHAHCFARATRHARRKHGTRLPGFSRSLFLPPKHRWHKRCCARIWVVKSRIFEYRHMDMRDGKSDFAPRVSRELP